MIRSAPPQAPPTLTFSVEFEFVVSTYEESTRDPLFDRRPGVFPASLVRNYKEIKKEQQSSSRMPRTKTTYQPPKPSRHASEKRNPSVFMVLGRGKASTKSRGRIWMAER